jgi:hypothetical protein
MKNRNMHEKKILKIRNIRPIYLLKCGTAGNIA